MPSTGSFDVSRLRSKLDAFWTLTQNLAKLSRCKRSQRGCVIVTDDAREVCGIGYNGPQAVLNNDACRMEEGNCGCIHAEANAVVKLRGYASDLILIATASPCEHCAGLIVNSGRIKAVLFQDYYRTTIGINNMALAGIPAYRIPDLMGQTTQRGSSPAIQQEPPSGTDLT